MTQFINIYWQYLLLSYKVICPKQQKFEKFSKELNTSDVLKIWCLFVPGVERDSTNSSQLASSFFKGVFSYFPHTLPQNKNLHNKSHFNELTSQISVETELKAKHSSTSSIWESLSRRSAVAHERECYQLLSPLHKGTLQSPKTGQCLCKIQETDIGTGNRMSAWGETAAE